MSNMLKRYRSRARVTITVEVRRSFMMLRNRSERTYSVALMGLTNMLRRFLDQTSSRKDTDMPCWLLNRMSQSMSAPRKKVTNCGTSPDCLER